MEALISRSMQVKLTIPQMIEKLDGMYEKERLMQNQVKILLVALEQIKEDIELAEQMIMYSSNKKYRGGV